MQMKIILIGGSNIVPIILIIMIIIIKINKYNIYIESELIELNKINIIIINKINRKMKYIYWILWLWGILLIFTTLNHLFIPIGLSNSLPYHLGYWLWTCALGIYIIPYIIYGYILIISHIEYGINSQLYNNKLIINNRIYYRELIISSNYNRKYNKIMEDIFCITTLLKGFNGLINWLYQICYFGVRLWLVFILHSFCLGCFGELFSIFTDQLLLLFPLYGIIGLGLPLSLLMILYLLLQIYVYISFSITFLFSTILSYFRNDFFHFLSFHGPHTFKLIPVSIIDLCPTHLYIYLLLLLILSYIFSRLWMFSNHFYYYNYISNHI